MEPISSERRKWTRRVGEVFNTSARLGYVPGSVWLRRDEEGKFAELLETKGVHICLDGPTGTGKSSMAATLLNTLQIKYAFVQVTESMDWAGFCKELVNPKTDRETSLSADIEGGIDQGLPHGKFRIQFGTRQRPSSNLELFHATIQSWTEHDVCRRMAKENAVLFLDDFEWASDALVRRVASMCKLLTQSFQSTYAKVVAVGTGDIYRKLYEANPSLELRLVELSLGTFPDKLASWRFLRMGWEALESVFKPKFHTARRLSIQRMLAM
jgi:hypothetical protein